MVIATLWGVHFSIMTSIGKLYLYYNATSVLQCDSIIDHKISCAAYLILNHSPRERVYKTIRRYNIDVVIL